VKRVRQLVARHVTLGMDAGLVARIRR
jgi:hypothetical protein